MSRIKTTTKLADAHDCDLIIEAIVENKDIKVDFYRVRNRAGGYRAYA